MNHAMKRRLVIRNVCLAVESPKSDEREMEPLAMEQAQRFLKATKGGRLHALYVLALTVVARQGELFGGRGPTHVHGETESTSIAATRPRVVICP